MLSLNSLTAEKRTKAAKRYFIINIAGLIRLIYIYIYFKNALTSKFKSKGMLLWRRGHAFVSMEN